MEQEFLIPKPAERIDQISERAFAGDPLQYTRIAVLNGDADLFYPHPDLQLRVRGENPASL